MEAATPALPNDSLHAWPAANGGGQRLADRIRWFLHRRGWDLRRYTPQASSEANLGLVLRRLGIRTALDVGAASGSFGRLLRRLGFEGTIVSFEPYPPSHRKLQAAAAGDARWRVMRPLALGEAPRASVTLRVSSNADSSSLYEMLDAHREALPGIDTVGSHAVEMTTLDRALAADPGAATEPMLLKLDTQGSELRILQGAAATLPRVAALHLELTLVPLYEGAPLAREVLEHPLLSGFDLWTAWPSFVRVSDGRMLQVDATFVRRGAAVAAGSAS